jgi:hypothetical protein
MCAARRLPPGYILRLLETADFGFYAVLTFHTISCIHNEREVHPMLLIAVGLFAGIVGLVWLITLSIIRRSYVPTAKARSRKHDRHERSQTE